MRSGAQRSVDSLCQRPQKRCLSVSLIDAYNTVATQRSPRGRERSAETRKPAYLIIVSENLRELEGAH